MGIYRTEFPIAASPARVWAVLSEFESWPEWNPSVPQISGDCRVGSKLRMTLSMPGRPSASVTAVVTAADAERRLHWHGNIGGNRIFAGTRQFDLAAQEDGTVVVTHVEDVSGLLFPVFRAVMGDAIQQHHDNLNQALKARSER